MFVFLVATVLSKKVEADAVVSAVKAEYSPPSRSQPEKLWTKLSGSSAWNYVAETSATTLEGKKEEVAFNRPRIAHRLHEKIHRPVRDPATGEKVMRHRHALGPMKHKLARHVRAGK